MHNKCGLMSGEMGNTERCLTELVGEIDTDNEIETIIREKMHLGRDENFIKMSNERIL